MPRNYLAPLTFAFLCCLFLSIPLSTLADDGDYDPIEPVNRAIFEFNDRLDEYVMEPVARGYDYITPRLVKNGINNFFLNLRTPIYLVSDIVQLKCAQASQHWGRFIINSTIGVAGIFDVASEVGLDPVIEDFGTGLGYHGVPPGPYIVIPLLGPSNLRDAFGRIVDGFLSPSYYLQDAGLVLGARALELTDDRRKLLTGIETAKKGSMDYYVFIRSTYHQRRLGLIYDGDLPPEMIEDPTYEDIEEDTRSDGSSAPEIMKDESKQ